MILHRTHNSVLIISIDQPPSCFAENRGYGTAAERQAAAALNQNSATQAALMKKRTYEQANGLDGERNPAALTYANLQDRYFNGGIIILL